MKHFEFNYNKKFTCIADKCKHNCCVGWEISIDKRTIKKYNNLKENDFRFTGSAFNGNSFNLDDNLRCPFLDGDNLCYIIKNYGDKFLCNTCKTHPRFKNFFTDRIETGLGLYCENACKIILTSKTKMKVSLVSGDNKNCKLDNFERKVLAFRKKIITILQNRKLSIKERLSLLEDLSDINLNKLSFLEWKNFFSTLEKLPINDFSFKNLKDCQDFLQINEDFSLEYEQLLCYLAFRHISRAIDYLDLRIRLAFIILSFKMINQIFSQCEQKSIENLIESCRFYTSEIECSDKNIDTILEKIEQLISFN